MSTQTQKTRTVIPPYRKLGRRLNAFPQGAPPTRLLFKILEILFSPEEAERVSSLPLMPFDAAKAAGIWKVNETEACKRLDQLAAKGLLLDIVTREDRKIYVLPPPMAGFFEFSLMRTRHDIDQKTLSELYYQYINVEEDFSKALFLSGKTQLGRIFVQEPALPADCSFQILDHEKASEVILTSTCIAVGLCYCRNKMTHIDRACSAPLSICMTFQEPAESLVRHGFARRVDAIEGMELLHQAYHHNLVQGGENVRNNVSFICHCCGCCCEGLIAARRFGFDHPIETSNFIVSLEEDKCRGCGKCVSACPVAALRLSKSSDVSRHKITLEKELCLGCGVCVRSCPHGAVALEPRPSRVITPVDMVYRMVLMAVERGVLQNLVFDNQALMSHRVMARLLGSILKLPPIKQAMANRQLQSRYIDALIAWKGPIFEHTGWSGKSVKTHAFEELQN